VHAQPVPAMRKDTCDTSLSSERYQSEAKLY
jgi:hypothetical protein